MAESLKIDFGKPIALFPLPNCVLLPGATIPLHIFEARYRQMTSDALDSLGLISMALFDGDQWRRDYEGKPPIRTHVCVGYVVRHHRYDDGRYDLLLQGICRAKVIREVEHDPYRMALLEPTETTQTMEIDLLDERQRLEKMLKDPLLSRLATVSAVQNVLSQEVPTPTLIDLAIMSVCEDAEDRYSMLIETRILQRFSFLEQLLRQTRKTLEMAERLRPPKTPDDISLN